METGWKKFLSLDKTLPNHQPLKLSFKLKQYSFKLLRMVLHISCELLTLSHTMDHLWLHKDVF